MEPPLYNLNSASVVTHEPTRPLAPWQIAILVGVVLILIAGCYYYFFIKNKGVLPLPTGTALFVRENLGFPDPLLKVNLATGVAISPTDSNLPAGDVIMDEIGDGNTQYYLLFNPQNFTSNIYSKTSSKPTLTQITNSSTFKYNLTYSSISHDFVYMSASGVQSVAALAAQKVWNVSLYDIAAQREANLGMGSHPAFLSTGTSIVFQKPDGLYIVDSASLQGNKLLSLSPASIFAVDSMLDQIVIYNFATKSLDYYGIAHANSVSYVRSEKIGYEPSFMTYAGSSLVLMNLTGPSSYTVQIDGSPKVLTLKLPQFAVPQSLTTAYGI